MDQGSTPTHNVGAVERPAATAATRAVTAVSGVRHRSVGERSRDYAGSILFVVPYLLFFVAFLLWPLVYAFWVSLRTWTTTGGDQGFTGLRHYYNLFFNFKLDETVGFWQSLENTAFFAVITIPLLVLLALIMALLLVNGPWRTFFRAVFYVPAILSVAVAMTVWLWILQNGGVLDTYLHNGIPWLIQQPWAWLSIIIATLWWTPGFNMIVLLAGLLNIPTDYYEAAKIDGANGMQRILYITLPLLRPVLAFVTVTQMIASFGLFGQPFILTHGGPSTIGGPTQSTTPVALQMYNEAFGTSQNLALACAMSFVLGLILVILAVLQLRFFRTTEM
ncbi:MAG: sugar ABC transporter permease [Chloroflexi bacterium]|nr:sugar ABC transporter permease [Chloroflexota bacterium]